MLHPIQVIARQTGLSAHVLRAWEKRYHAVTPERSASQRRLYSQEDLERLRLLRQATQNGHPIGSIAQLPLSALEQLVKAEAKPLAAPVPEKGSETATERFVVDCVAAIRRFDEAALRACFEEAAVELGYNGMIRQTAAPLIERIGELWERGELKMAHEHFASAAIRNFLLNPVRQFVKGSAHSTLIVATPQGQLHELGAVLVSALAVERGWHTVYLGASLPAVEIAGVARSNHARAVALSIVYPDDDPHLERELRDLRRLLPAETAILTGGSAASHYRSSLEAIEAIQTEDLSAFQDALGELRRAPVKRS